MTPSYFIMGVLMVVTRHNERAPCIGQHQYFQINYGRITEDKSFVIWGSIGSIVGSSQSEPRLNINTVFPGMGLPMLNIRRSRRTCLSVCSFDRPSHFCGFRTFPTVHFCGFRTFPTVSRRRDYLQLIKKWSSRHLNSPVPLLFVSHFIQADIKENTKAPHHCPFARGIHRSAGVSLHKGPVMRKTFPYNNVMMTYPCPNPGAGLAISFGKWGPWYLTVYVTMVVADGVRIPTIITKICSQYWMPFSCSKCIIFLFKIGPKLTISNLRLVLPLTFFLNLLLIHHLHVMDREVCGIGVTTDSQTMGLLPDT